MAAVDFNYFILVLFTAFVVALDYCSAVKKTEFSSAAIPVEADPSFEGYSYQTLFFRQQVGRLVLSDFTSEHAEHRLVYCISRKTWPHKPL